MNLVTLSLLTALLPGLCFACLPGRGGIRRRGARKLTPLVYKQHVPNFSERSLAASGLPVGAVSRNDDAFRRLVVNHNPDILFKDEEGTGADRLMTQRCKEKLNTLSISVMNQWPGIHLRVTEAWDEDFLHAHQSLHYEGRAVDLTTSDRDRRKYGMLARLAVEAGFDWVYYESRSHIHASCKSEAQHPSKSGGCFSASSTVLTSSGERKPMSELRVGDSVLTINPATGEPEFSPVILFLDRNATEKRQFYTLVTDSGQTLTLTPSHLLYRLKDNNVSPPDDETVVNTADFEVAFARDIREGDRVLVLQRGRFVSSRITHVRVEVLDGVYAPLTAAGNLVVDQVVASCYAIIDSQWLAHSAFGPVRWYRAAQALLSPSSASSSDPWAEGVHWYADWLYSIAHRIIPSHMK